MILLRITFTLLYLKLCLFAVTTHKNTSHFIWMTDVWEACISDHCGDGGRQLRKIWCIHKNGERHLASKCDPNQKPTEVRLCFKVCEEHRNLVEWIPHVWQPCDPLDFDSPSVPDCNMLGLQNRNVTCQWKENKNVLDDSVCSYFEPKPNTQEVCKVPCHQECIVTDYGLWSECNKCGNRVRIRNVVVAPSPEMEPCLPLSEIDFCNTNTCTDDLSHNFSLYIGAWGPCKALIPSNSNDKKDYIHKAVIGVQTRSFTCRNGEGTSVKIRHCIQKENISQVCIVPQDCQVTMWSPWQIINETCVTTVGKVKTGYVKRTRQVTHLPLGDGQACPHLEELEVMVYKNHIPSCIKYKWIASEWSHCSSMNSGENFLCGGGIQYRNVTCVRAQDNIPISEDLCSDTRPDGSQQCYVACAQDCILSSWSFWSHCITDTCEKTLKHKGFRKRLRSVLQEPNLDGKLCLHLEEIQPCTMASCYNWRIEDFGPCHIISNTLTCGPGRRKRLVYCIDHRNLPTSEHLCSGLSPASEESCHIPCPNDCVISDWDSWSPCSEPCRSKDRIGIQLRNRTVIAYSGSGGKFCPNKSELTQRQECNLHSCVFYNWHSAPSGICHMNDSKQSCGDGIQLYNVTCLQENWKQVPEKRCEGITKPLSSQKCSIPCPQDCSMTSYTDWTPCPTVCEKEGIIENSQMRERFILKFPSYEGLPCPTALREYRMCNVPCFYYTWDFSDWSICTLKPNSTCGNGLSTRSVYCKRNDGQMVSADFCVKYSNPSIPYTAQKCTISCDDYCVLNEWSPWSDCSSNCLKHQIRTRALLDGSQFQERCHKSHLVEETLECPCLKYHVQAQGEWSDCILSQSDSSNDVHIWSKSFCGVGKKYRAMACCDSSQNLVELTNCNHAAYQEEICIIPCSMDCVMSSWSNWTECSSTCGPGMNMRFRDRLISPSYGGRECPSLNELGQETEVNPCYQSCQEFKWIPDTWGRCKSIIKAKCGPGIKLRKVRCVHVMKYSSPKEVSSNYCDESLQPANITDCMIFCPGECVTSPWSSWSDCNQPCSESNVRQRSRAILRYPDIDHELCSDLNQTEYCLLGKNCYTFIWSFTRWSNCILPSSSTCGPGKQFRQLLCVRNDGKSVSLDLCDKENAVRPTPTEATCHKTCPVDCQLSTWANWDTEMCKCGEHELMTRKHIVIQQAIGLGRTCQEPLLQFKPCPIRPCYHWKRSLWSTCDLQGANCGYGFRSRNVTCVTQTGREVIHEHCINVNHSSDSPHPTWWKHLLNIHVSEVCHIPCPSDCKLSEWSEWGHCHRRCNRGQQVGYQTRSHAVLVPPSLSGEPCPQQLWQTRPCIGGPCLTFDWYIQNDIVTCRRKDGLKVIGGCHGKPRPCYPSCLVQYSLCSAGACICQPGYSAVLGSDNKLHACEQNMFLMTNGTESSSGSSGVSVCYYPPDGLNFWMFAVILAGLSFIAFVGFSVYTMSRETLKRCPSHQGMLRATIKQPDLNNLGHSSRLISRTTDAK